MKLWTKDGVTQIRRFCMQHYNYKYECSKEECIKNWCAVVRKDSCHQEGYQRSQCPGSDSEKDIGSFAEGVLKDFAAY